MSLCTHRVDCKLVGPSHTWDDWLSYMYMGTECVYIGCYFPLCGHVVWRTEGERYCVACACFNVTVDIEIKAL